MNMVEWLEKTHDGIHSQVSWSCFVFLSSSWAVCRCHHAGPDPMIWKRQNVSGNPATAQNVERVFAHKEVLGKFHFVSWTEWHSVFSPVQLGFCLHLRRHHAPGRRQRPADKFFIFFFFFFQCDCRVRVAEETPLWKFQFPSARVSIGSSVANAGRYSVFFFFHQDLLGEVKTTANVSFFPLAGFFFCLSTPTLPWNCCHRKYRQFPSLTLARRDHHRRKQSMTDNAKRKFYQTQNNKCVQCIKSAQTENLCLPFRTQRALNFIVSESTCRTCIENFRQEIWWPFWTNKAQLGLVSVRNFFVKCKMHSEVKSCSGPKILPKTAGWGFCQFAAQFAHGLCVSCFQLRPEKEQRAVNSWKIWHIRIKQWSIEFHWTRMIKPVGNHHGSKQCLFQVVGNGCV